MSFLVTRPARPLPGMALQVEVVLRGHLPDQRGRPAPEPLFGGLARAVAADVGRGAAGRGRRGSAPLGPARGAGFAGAGGAGRGRGGRGGRGRRAGTGGAGAAGATAAPASVSILATTVWTATVCPSVTRISARTPATGAGISASTLSVEISKIGSSRFTASPTFFIQRDRVPSAMDSPIWGMITSILAILSGSPVSTPRASGPRARCPPSAGGRNPPAAARTAAARRARRPAAPARPATRRPAR